MIYVKAPHEITHFDTCVYFHSVVIVYIVLIRIVLNHLIDQSEQRLYFDIAAYGSKCAIINGSRTECHQEKYNENNTFLK